MNFLRLISWAGIAFFTTSTLGADWESERTILNFNTAVEPIATSADGMVVLSRAGNQIVLLDKSSNKIKQYNFESTPSIACLNPQGSQFLIIDGKCIILTDQIMDQSKKIDNETGQVTTAQYAPNGEVFLTLSDDEKVRIYSSATGQLEEAIEISGGIKSAIFDTKGNLLIGANEKQLIFYLPKKNVLEGDAVSPYSYWDRLRTLRQYLPNPSTVERVANTAIDLFAIGALFYELVLRGPEQEGGLSKIIVLVLPAEK